MSVCIKAVVTAFSTLEDIISHLQELHDCDQSFWESNLITKVLSSLKVDCMTCSEFYTKYIVDSEPLMTGCEECYIFSKSDIDTLEVSPSKCELKELLLSVSDECKEDTIVVIMISDTVNIA